MKSLSPTTAALWSSVQLAAVEFLETQLIHLHLLLLLPLLLPLLQLLPLLLPLLLLLLL